MKLLSEEIRYYSAIQSHPYYRSPLAIRWADRAAILEKELAGAEATLENEGYRHCTNGRGWARRLIYEASGAHECGACRHSITDGRCYSEEAADAQD